LQRSDAELIIIAATNRPDCIDPALLRPGRFDRLLYLAPPDEDARRAIFGIHTRGMPLSADVDFERLAADTDGYSGADIAAVCQQAALIALDSSDDANEVTMTYFEEGAHRVVPSSMDSGIEEMYESFRRRVA
jgi:transitional endoplasmic reticulum ATPase